MWLYWIRECCPDMCTIFNSLVVFLSALNNIGSAWYGLGDFKKAGEHFKQAYDIFREFYGEEYPHTIAIKDWLDSVR